MKRRGQIIEGTMRKLYPKQKGTLKIHYLKNGIERKPIGKVRIKVLKIIFRFHSFVAHLPIKN